MLALAPVWLAKANRWPRAQMNQETTPELFLRVEGFWKNLSMWKAGVNLADPWFACVPW